MPTTAGLEERLNPLVCTFHGPSAEPFHGIGGDSRVGNGTPQSEHQLKGMANVEDLNVKAHLSDVIHEAWEKEVKSSTLPCINMVLTDDTLRLVLSKLDTQSDKDTYGLVCKRWLLLQNNERKHMGVRAGPIMLKRLAARFTRLVNLDFAQYVSRSFYPGVNDGDLTTIACSFQQLQRINLQNCKGITDAGLVALGRGLPCLQWVDITDCKKVTDKGVEALATGCPKLLGLLLGRCKLVSDRALEALSANCRELQLLDLHSCIHITDKGLINLVQGCTKFETLNLSKCVRVGDDGVCSIGFTCLSLVELDLSDCSRITDKAITLLAQNCKVIGILVLSGCRLLGDLAIEALAKEGGHHLANLQLDWCSEITDAAVRILLENVKALEVFYLQNSSIITDHAVYGLHEDSMLKQLKLSGCPGLTNAGVCNIARSCKKLQLLEVKYCWQVTDEAVGDLNFPPGCKVVLSSQCFAF